MAQSVQIQDIAARIDKNQAKYIEYVKELVSQPSISTQNIGIVECAEKVRETMERVGLKAKLLKTRGNPVVFGEYRNPKAKNTILFYNHYDVQPPEPLDQWKSPPFKPEVREDKLFGRGSSDNKGTFASRIAAVNAIFETLNECPVNLKFMVEGEEEIGSPNLASFAEENKQLLKSDAIIWEGSDRHPSGRPTITLGNKGIVYLDFHARGPKADQHSSRAPLLPNPAWRLVGALSTLKSPDGKILIDGFYQSVKKPTKVAESLLEKVPLDLEEEKRLSGLDHLLGEGNRNEARRRLFFEPTCTINGLLAGYAGKGMKTIVPAEAHAKMDIRLVPDQDPDEIYGLVKIHLAKNGFDDIDVQLVARMYPSRTDPETPIAQVAMAAARSVYGVEPIVYPNHVGSGAMYVAVNNLKAPSVAIGAAYFGSGMHSPNEHIRLEDYRLATKHIATILLSYPSAA